MDDLDRTVRVEADDNGKIVIDASFRDKETIRLVPGSRWDPEERVWRVPLSWAAMQQLRGVFGNRLEIGEKLTRLAWQVKELRVDPAMRLRDATELPPDHPIEQMLQEFGV